MLDKFKGINKERELTEREKTLLEKMIELKEKIFDIEWIEDIEQDKKIREKVSTEIKKLPEYNEDDLKIFILSQANNEYPHTKQDVLGHYTGLLLDVLTERNQAKKQKTKLYIDGKGNSFSKLFCFAKNVDELILDNFSGNYICESLGHEGIVNLAILNNIKGNWVLNGAGMLGKMRMLVANNIVGESNLEAITQQDTKTEIVIANNIQGNNYLFGLFGRPDGPNIDTLILRKVFGENTELGNFNKQYSVSKVFYDNCERDPATYMHANKSIPRESASESYQKIFSLVEQMDGKTGLEIAEIAEKIYSIYKSEVKDV